MGERRTCRSARCSNLLKEEFPDVTISKIRFLESQGLLDPERTPSGYRKFYDDDIDRLRWILRQQRENFLPLKVIKGRLGERPAEPDVPGRTAVTPSMPSRARRRRRRPVGAGAGPRTARRHPLRRAGARTRSTRASTGGEHDARGAVPRRPASTPRQVGELERFGLLAGRAVGGRHLLRRGGAGRRPAGGRRSAATASRPATCACTRCRPSARPASSSSWSCR